MADADSLTIPTLNELVTSVRRYMGATDPDVLARSDADVFARAIAGTVYGVYGYAQVMAKEILPDSCSESRLTNFWGPFYLAGDTPTAAVAASGTVRFTGTVGKAIDAGVELQRSDGALFTVDVGGVVGSGGYVDLAVTASEAGADGDTAANIWLTLSSAVDGIDAEAQVGGDGLSGGADEETTESYRARTVSVREAGAQTGRCVDWENWAQEVAGVTRAWAAPSLMGVGTITVFIMRDGDSNPYPGGSECAAVKSHLLATGMPFGEVYVAAPVQKLIDFSIQLTPDTPAVRTTVRAALKEVIAAAASPLARDGNDRTVLPAEAVTILRSHLDEAISGADGETDHVMSVPAADIACAIGELAELGTITWL